MSFLERATTSVWLGLTIRWAQVAFGLRRRPIGKLNTLSETMVACPDGFPRDPIGIGMVAPTIAFHGTGDQRTRHLRSLYAGEIIWCQLFSEPGAGSDLASLATRAARHEKGWSITGQKVWTSMAHAAGWGLLLARTDLDVPKHRGLTCFLLDINTPGVGVRPLR